MSAVKILYFAKIRDAAGVAEETREIPDTIATVGDLADLLAQQWPIFNDRVRLRAAVDQVMCGFDAGIAGAREVAFFPPVTGG